MPDRGKVINALGRCESYGYCEDMNCPYYKNTNCLELLRKDALILLKEQDNCENCAIAIEDRQPVVRCKNCKHHLECDYWIENGDDWFCADGERKSNGND